MPATSVRGANVILDPMVLLDDEFDVLDAPLANEFVISTVNVQPVELAHYRYEKVWLNVEQIADRTFSFQDIQSSHVKCAVASMLALEFVYRNGMITVTCLQDSNRRIR